MSPIMNAPAHGKRSRKAAALLILHRHLGSNMWKV